MRIGIVYGYSVGDFDCFFWCFWIVVRVVSLCLEARVFDFVF